MPSNVASVRGFSAKQEDLIRQCRKSTLAVALRIRGQGRKPGTRQGDQGGVEKVCKSLLHYPHPQADRSQAGGALPGGQALGRLPFNFGERQSSECSQVLLPFIFPFFKYLAILTAIKRRLSIIKSENRSFRTLRLRARHSEKLFAFRKQTPPV